MEMRDSVAKIELKHIHKTYAHKKLGEVKAVKDVSLFIDNGELLTFLGPSGCGKSSTLRMIAGLEEITKGKILFDESLVNHLTPSERNISMAFETYSLYTHLNVYENIAFSLKASDMDEEKVKEKVYDISEKLYIEDILESKPLSLSGGQQQRVSLARALVRDDPNIYVLDEPISHVGAEIRNDIRASIRKMVTEKGVTTIFVTHDQLDALALADKIAVMKDGRIQQVATGEKLYWEPNNLFVAEFVGEPPINTINLELKYIDGNIILENECLTLDPPKPISDKIKSNLDNNTNKVILGIRPQACFVLSNYTKMNEKKEIEILKGEVEFNEWGGVRDYLHIALDKRDEFFVVTKPRQKKVEEKEEIEIFFEWDKVIIFDAETEKAIK